MRVLSNALVAASQMRTVPSLLPLARRVPSSEKATAKTMLVCPVRVLSDAPVAASQIRIVLSPIASHVPSGENTTEKIVLVSPLKTLAWSKRAGAMHWVSLDAPWANKNLPVGQTLQSVNEEAPMEGEKEPAGHFAHPSLFPGREAKLPAGQGRHSRGVLAPRRGL